MTLNEVWNLSYDEYVSYLLQKYGPAKYDYFCSPECNSENKNVKRTKEGLECHHIDEKHAILLSNPRKAPDYPFEYQKADRLVYADRIEHLLLHHKIVIENDNKKKNFLDLPSGGTFGCGSRLIIGRINSIFQNTPTNWEKNMLIKINDYFGAYIEILHRIQFDYVLHGCSKDMIGRTIFATTKDSPQPTIIIEAFKNHKRKDDYEFE